MTKYLTASEMRLFNRCKRKWWLSQYRKLVKADNTNFNKPLGIGNRVHEALAAYYTPERPVDPRDFLQKMLADDLTKHPQHEDDIRKEAELARLMIEGYMEWLEETGEDQALTVVQAEGATAVRLQPERDVFLLSKIDAEVRHDVYGENLAMEHKTVGTLNQYLPELQLNPQVLTEHLVKFMDQKERGEDPETARGVLFNMLRKVKRTASAKPPFYSRTVVRHSVEELRNHWRHVVSIADEIENVTRRLDSGEDHQLVVPPNPTDTCSWQCEFFRICPLVDGREDHEMALAASFVVGNPLARYDGLIDQ